MLKARELSRSCPANRSKSRRDGEINDVTFPMRRPSKWQHELFPTATPKKEYSTHKQRVLLSNKFLNEVYSSPSNIYSSIKEWMYKL